MRDRTQDIEIANEILRQLGGYGKLKAMIAIKDHLAVESGLSFKFSGSKKVNYAKIVLNSMDLYDIDFGKISMKKTEFGGRMPEYKKVKEYDGVYNDQLKEIFESFTGLYLSLF